MSAKPDVRVVIAGDTKGLEKSLDKSGKALGGFGKTAAGVFGGIAIAKVAGLAIDGAKAIGNFALDGIDKLDAMGDAMARLDGLAAGLGDTAASADLTKFGVDKGEAAASALAIAKTGKSLGLTGKQLGKVTPDLVEMSAQLASLGDGDPEKQASLLAKALGGSAKAAKELGVKLPKGKDVTPMQQYAALMAQLAPKLDKATSGQASLADVGDRWDATMGNLQLQLAGFLEKLAPVISELMDVLMPLLQKFIDVVGPLVAEAFGAIADAVSGFLADGGGQKVADIFGRIMDILGQLVEFVVTNILPELGKIGGAIGKAIEPLLPLIEDLWTELMPVLQRLADFFGDVIVPVLVNVVIPAVGKVLEILLKLATWFLKNLGPMIDAAAKGFDALVDILQPVLDILNAIFGLAGDVIGKLSNIHLPSIPGINAAAAGAPSAGTFATAGVSVTIQTGVGDPVAIGRTVARYLDAYAARGGR